MDKHFRHAVELVKTHKFDNSNEYKLCSLIVKGGKVLSIGYNSRDWNSMTEAYKVHDWCSSTHAEMAAILAKRKKVRFEGSKIYVVRLRADGSLGMAKPCQMCENVLRNYGIKRAIYSIETNEYGVVKYSR